ncbi:MAG TPA: hypothetical protein DCG75_00125 [Bacteroidales bacterium]|nr:hypothetical protein [Bacteroidales bacterium]
MNRVKILIFFFFGIPILSYSQSTENISISIVDSETKEAIPFATIHLLNSPDIGWAANMQGIIRIESLLPGTMQNDSLLVKSLGYQQKTTHLNRIKSDSFHIYLQPQIYNLSELIVKPSQDKAIHLIQKAIAHRKENSPTSIDHFNCEIYNKTTIDFVPNREYYSNAQIEKIQANQDRSHLFIFEKYSSSIFQNGTMMHESVKSHRLSGFKDPTIENFTSQIQPFHFYEPIIPLFENTYINPISQSGISNYGYQITDSIYVENDTIVGIEYFPQTLNKSLLKGIVHISLKNYAITKVTAEPAIQELLSLKIEQEYKRIKNHYLPHQLNYQLVFKKYPNKKYGLKFESYTYINDYQFNLVEIKPATNQNDLISMDSLRPLSLSLKEQNTYIWADSIGQAKNFDGKLRFINKFSQGKIPYKRVDFDLTQIQYNLHEKYRLGIGLYTNEYFSKRITIGGFIAYGTGDYQNKYGGLMGYKFPKQKIEIEAIYKTDVVESGALDMGFTKKSGFWRTMMKDSLNRSESLSISIQKKVSHSTFLLGVKKENIQDLNFNYGKLNFTEIYASAIINLNKKQQNFYEPNNLSYKFPILYLTYVKGINGLGSHFSYSRLSSFLEYSYYVEGLGKQSVFIAYDKLFGGANLPYYKFISGYGAYCPSLPFYEKNYFQTMLPYEFTHSESLVMHLKHTFLKPLYYTKLSEPRISLLQSAGWGRNEFDLTNQFKIFDKGYFESGLHIENIVKINYINFAYIGLGAGVFVKYGDYASSTFSDNIVYKLSFSVIF